VVRTAVGFLFLYSCHQIKAKSVNSLMAALTWEVVAISWHEIFCSTSNSQSRYVAGSYLPLKGGILNLILEKESLPAGRRGTRRALPWRSAPSYSSSPTHPWATKSVTTVFNASSRDPMASSVVLVDVCARSSWSNRALVVVTVESIRSWNVLMSVTRPSISARMSCSYFLSSSPAMVSANTKQKGMPTQG
jgi:hypothetical protein